MITSCTWLSRRPAGRDPQEARVLVQLEMRIRARAAVAHAGAQAAHELIDQVGQRSLGGHAAFDAFRHQLGTVGSCA
jgi:hypothetical protein